MMLEPSIPPGLSRREFLRGASLGALALALPGRWTAGRSGPGRGLLGRVADPTADVFRMPSFGSEKIKTCWRDDVLPLGGAVLGERVPGHNRIWYVIEGLGYTHSASIQPVRDEPNQPLPSIPSTGRLMEVTVPFIDAYWHPRFNAEKVYRFYYATTHWVTGVSRDVLLNKWYRISDDKWVYTYYAPATAFRAISASELAPISPHVPMKDKRIEVDLGRQSALFYEGSNLVFTTRISSGRKFGAKDYWTPEGSFVTFRKRGTRHMAAGNLATGYDLPGVPWVSYITESGVSFHGTFWHNDYGVPRSHGCINMTPEAAKWLYRWTQPSVPADEREVWVSYGTRVDIHA